MFSLSSLESGKQNTNSYKCGKFQESVKYIFAVRRYLKISPGINLKKIEMDNRSYS